MSYPAWAEGLVNSTFLDQKIISSRSNLKTVKKLQTGNLLVEVESKKHAENLLRMEKFHNLKCRIYPHAKSNTSNGVVRSKELSLAKLEDIETTFKKQWWNHTKRNQNWLHNRKGRAVYTSSPEMFQMSKIWTLQRNMQRTLSMWQMWWTWLR